MQNNMKQQKENYLEKIPLHKKGIGFEVDQSRKVTLLIENKGIFNRIAQKLFKKPKISYVHLDDMGSFVWPLIDGERDITEIGKMVDEHFGEKAHPLYERLAKYFQILESYGFISWKQ